MAGGVIYLDSDDEITSAAARIRDVDGRRVAVVLPYGSRVATSRINFRLLARDAQTHEKRLSIVSGDAATRALAASAGLPVFGSVGEYETSLEGAGRSGVDATVGEAAAGAAGAAAGLAASQTVVTPAGRTAPTTSGQGGASGVTDPRRDEVDTGATTIARPAAVRPDADAATADPPGAARGALAPSRVQPGTDRAGPPAASPRTERVARPAGGRWGRTPIVAGLLVLALAVVVGGVAAYLLLPSATIAVTPREETIGPVPFRVTASTTATEPDTAAGVVPASVVELEVEAADTFAATGKRVEEEQATGGVRFENLDFTASNTIAKGAVVSTESGVRFRTDKAITVPRAELVGLMVVPSTASVSVTAVDPGPEGNVAANTITAVPRGEEPLFLKVNNPDATSGGSRTEFPRVRQADVDAAVESLTAELDSAFAVRLDDPDLSDDGATVFPETASLGQARFSADLDGLVGQEVETFDLAAAATGTVTSVDAAPVRVIAEERLASSVEPGYQLVDGSSDISVDPAVVSGGTISFPVVVTARQVRVLDPVALEEEVRGRPVADARTILETYGTVDLVVWPDWVATIPTIDGRVDVRVDGPTAEDGQPDEEETP